MSDLKNAATLLYDGTEASSFSELSSSEEEQVAIDEKGVEIPLKGSHPDLSALREDDDELPLGNFSMRPHLFDKFKPEVVREIMHNILVQNLKGKEYNSKQADEWVKMISLQIRNKVKELRYKKYKLMVHVVLGEQKGSGVKIASRCLWDADSDGYTFDTFMNDHLFCTAVCYAVFFY